MAIKKQHGLRTHGHTSPRENRGSRQSPTYVSWAMMMSRCFYPKNISFKNYGANGIGVCERWLRFENFLADMDIRPYGTSLDRLDKSKGYMPSNCRWATSKEQAREKSKFIEFDGKTLNITDWANEVGLKRTKLSNRLLKGWSVEEALTVPAGGDNSY